MKNNSFNIPTDSHGPKGFKPAKKLVLTALLATVLSGPYIYQISSKDFSTSEFASTASELSETDKFQIVVKVDEKMALEKLKKSDPKYNDLTTLPPSSEMTDPALKAVVAAVEAKKATLATRLADAEKEKLIKAEEQKRKDEIEAGLKAAKEKKEAAEKSEKEKKEAAEKAEKEKKEKAAEAKEKDCTDKDKTSAEKRDCREDAKREEKEKKVEAASKKFEDRLEKAMDRCNKTGSSKDLEAYEDKELTCKSKAFVDALRSGNKDLSSAAVNSQFRHLFANKVDGIDLFSMLYSSDERDAERASIILSNIFNGNYKQFPGLKRMIMDEVRRRADAPAKKVAAEFKKANQLPQNSAERTAQFTAAVAAKSDLESKIEVYSSSMMYPLQKIGDRDALAYYHSSYTKGIESLLLKVMTGTSAIGGEVGGATRGGTARGGSTTTTEGDVVRGADGKMTQTNTGTRYELIQPGTPLENIRFGTPTSTRSSGERLGNRISK